MVKSTNDRPITVLVALLLVLSLSFLAYGETLTVSKRGDGFDSIQKAINKASAGDVVYVKEGTYRENLHLNKDITIKGTGSKAVNIISKEKGQPVILAGPSSAEINLAGVAIKGATGSKCPDVDKGVCPVGLSATGKVQISVVGAQIRGNSIAGILLQDSSQLSLVNSVVVKNGCTLKGGKISIFPAGIELLDSSRANLKEVELTQNSDGILPLHFATVEINKCKVSGSQKGIWVGNQAEILIENSEILNNKVGIIGQGGKVKLSDSKISENKLGVEFDLTKASMENVSIKRNKDGGILRESTVRLNDSTIKANRRTGLSTKGNSIVTMDGVGVADNGFYGVHLFDNSRATIKSSSFRKNEDVAMVTQQSSKATVNHSDFLKNGKAIQIAGSSGLVLKNSEIKDNETGIEIAIPEDFSGSLIGFGNEITSNKNKFSGVMEKTRRKLVADQRNEKVANSSEGEKKISVAGNYFDKIQDAIDIAEPGETIRIEKGVYKTNLTIDKNLTLRGTGPEEVKIVGKKKGRPVLLAGPSHAHINLTGLTLAKAPGSKCPSLTQGVCPSGVFAIGDAKVKMTEVRISKNRVGVSGLGSSRIKISSSVIAGNRRAGIWLAGSSSSALLKNSKIENNGKVGMISSGSSRVEIVGTTVSGHSKAGIVTGQSSQIRVNEAKIKQNKGGIMAGDSSNVTVIHSLLRNNDEIGFAIAHSATGSISKSSISKNKVGVGLKQSPSLDLKRNEICGNEVGVRIYKQKSFKGSLQGSGNEFSANSSDFKRLSKELEKRLKE